MSAEPEQIDGGRRHFLLVATTVTGLAGAAATAVPFLASWKPSARAQALGAPVEQDISKLEAGGGEVGGGEGVEGREVDGVDDELVVVVEAVALAHLDLG